MLYKNIVQKQTESSEKDGSDSAWTFFIVKFAMKYRKYLCIGLAEKPEGKLGNRFL